MDYSAIYRSDILTYASTWMNLEKLMLSEKKPDREKAHMIYMIYQETNLLT